MPPRLGRQSPEAKPGHIGWVNSALNAENPHRNGHPGGHERGWNGGKLNMKKFSDGYSRWLVAAPLALTQPPQAQETGQSNMDGDYAMTAGLRTQYA